MKIEMECSRTIGGTDLPVSREWSVYSALHRVRYLGFLFWQIDGVGWKIHTLSLHIGLYFPKQIVIFQPLTTVFKFENGYSAPNSSNSFWAFLGGMNRKRLLRSFFFALCNASHISCGSAWFSDVSDSWETASAAF